MVSPLSGFKLPSQSGSSGGRGYRSSIADADVGHMRVKLFQDEAARQQAQPRPAVKSTPQPKPQKQPSFWERFAGLSRPVSQGGINIFADAGNAAEGLIEGTVDSAKNAYDQARIATKAGDVGGGGINKKLVLSEQKAVDDAVRNHQMTKAEGAAHMARVNAKLQTRQGNIKKAEKEVGVKYDPNRGAIDAVSTLLSVDGPAELLGKGAATLGRYLTKGAGRAAEKNAAAGTRDVAKELVAKPGKQVPARSAALEANRPKQLSLDIKDLAQAEPEPVVRRASSKPYGKTVENRLTTGGKAGRQNLSPEAQKLISGEHAIRNTKALGERNAAAADSFKNTSDLVDAAHQRLSVKTGTISDEDVAFVDQAIKRAGKEGDYKAETALHDALSEHLTRSGQTVQAASLLYNMSPEGLYYKAVRDLKKANPKGYEIPDDVQTQLREMRDDVGKAAEGRDKQIATARMQKLVAKHIPKGKLQGAISVWKAGLLSSPVTHGGNVLSNAVFGTLKKVSDVPATVADVGLTKLGKTRVGKAIGLSGERSRGLTLRGLKQGGKEGVENAKLTMKEGIDLRDMNGGKYEGHGELNFENPAIQAVFGKTSNLVFRGMNAADQPFYYAAAKNSLYDQAVAAGRNKGLKGAELDNFVKETVDNPTKAMAEQAEKDAKTAVLGEDRPISTAVSNFASSHPAFQVIVPFTKVPTNFLAQTLDYTPAGFVKSLVKDFAGKNVDQRAFTEAIGKAATGTGVIYIGAEMANNGLVSGTYPTDPKEQQRWKSEGIQPNSIKIGNQWIGLNYMGPLGILLQAGKDYHDAAVAGDNAAMQAIAGVGKSLTGQSFLTGFSGFANALNDPGRYGENLVNQQAGSVVPNWLRATANATDESQRQINNPGEAIINGIPGARTALKQKQDVYGNPLSQKTDPLSTLFNPLKPSTSRTDTSPAITEINRLHNVDQNDADLQVTPTVLQKTLKIGGKNVKLSDDQQYELQGKIGKSTQSIWNKLIKSPGYKSLSDADKAKVLDLSRKDVLAVEKYRYGVSHNLTNMKSWKKLTKAQRKLYNEGTYQDYVRKVTDK